jgi:hypothetical protein
MRVGQWVKVIIFRRPRRVACGRCGASHPAIYEGQQCLICRAMIVAAPVNIPPALDAEKSDTRADGIYKAELAELKLECEELRAALQAARTRPDPVRLSDFERYVQLAAQGLAKRETYPLPTSVKTPEAFYVVMACAALDATGLWEPSAAQTGDPTNGGQNKKSLHAQARKPTAIRRMLGLPAKGQRRPKPIRSFIR